MAEFGTKRSFLSDTLIDLFCQYPSVSSGPNFAKGRNSLSDPIPFFSRRRSGRYAKLLRTVSL
jgi:hypothetical protein